MEPKKPSEAEWSKMIEKYGAYALKRQKRKFLRRTIVSIILAGVSGAVMSLMGFNTSSWQFWVMVLVINGQFINGAL